MHEHNSAGARSATPTAGSQLSPNELRTITSHLAGQEDLWRPQVVHDPDTRWRSQLLWSPQVEIWLIGWGTGQGVELHDHGGASGAFSVCEGALDVRHGSRLRPQYQMQQRTLHRGDSVTFDGAHVHEVANHSATPATTIHAYSPALTTMDFYDMVAGELLMVRRAAVGAPEPTVVATPVGAGCA